MLEVMKDAFHVATKKPLTWVALVAVPLIVACFGLLYFNTFMNPYDRMKSLPIAVVNEDAGAIVDGKMKNYGSELVDSICKNDSALWTVEDAQLVDDGLENSDYFLAVVIPEDFSKRVAAGQTGKPETAGISFYKNVRKNYMLSTLSNNIENALSNTVNEEVSAQYVSAYVEGLQSAGDGFAAAADGAQALSDGLQSAHNGAASLADGAVSIQNGTAALQSGTSSLSEGASKLNAQSATLTDGSTAVANGLAALADGSSAYAAALDDKAAALAAQMGGDADTASALAKQQLEAALKEYATNIVIAAKSGQDPTAVDSSAVQASAQSIANIAAATGAYEALCEASSGYTAIDSGISQLNAQYVTFNAGLIVYSQGVSQLADGASSAQSGATALVSGATQLKDGTDSLASGIQTAQSGSAELEQQLADGADTISDSLTGSVNELADYAMNPIDMQTDTYGNLPSFGYGFSPLFLTMCMWLGALIIFFVFSPYPSRAHIGASRFAAVFGRWPLYLCMSAAEAAVVCIGAVLSGLPCTDLGMLCLLFAVIAFSFMCIMQFFNLFDVAGKAIAVLLLILQLVCCSGTLPAELGTDFAVTAGPLMPFYYAIDAFREIMSGGVVTTALADMGMLLAFAAAFVALTLLAYPIGLKMKAKLDANAVEAITGKTLEEIGM